MKFKGDIIITDPCYICKPGDWEKTDCGKNLDVIGLKTWISRPTTYDDWDCVAIEEETGKELGNFCADASMVAVMQLDEVLRYNPDFDYHESVSCDTVTLIEGFDGEIDFKEISGIAEYDDGEKGEEKSLQVIGKGNINFVTWETDFYEAKLDGTFIMYEDMEDVQLTEEDLAGLDAAPGTDLNVT